MSVFKTLQSAITTGLRFPVGVGFLGPSGIQGRTCGRRLNSVRRIARRMAQRRVDATTAQDVAQRVVEAVWKRLEKDPTYLDKAEEIPGKVHGIVENVVRMGRRTDARRPEEASDCIEDHVGPPNEWSDPELALRAHEAQELEERALARLSPAEREVFELSRGPEQLTHQEIADRLGKSLSTVRQQMTHANSVMRAEFVAAGLEPPAPRGRKADSGSTDLSDSQSALGGGQ